MALWVRLQAKQAGPLLHLEDSPSNTPNYGLQLNVDHSGQLQQLMGDGQGSGFHHWSAWSGPTTLPIEQ